MQPREPQQVNNIKSWMDVVITNITGCQYLLKCEYKCGSKLDYGQYRWRAHLKIDHNNTRETCQKVNR